MRRTGRQRPSSSLGRCWMLLESTNTGRSSHTQKVKIFTLPQKESNMICQLHNFIQFSATNINILHITSFKWCGQLPLLFTECQTFFQLFLVSSWQCYRRSSLWVFTSGWERKQSSTSVFYDLPGCPVSSRQWAVSPHGPPTCPSLLWMSWMTICPTSSLARSFIMTTVTTASKSSIRYNLNTGKRN